MCGLVRPRVAVDAEVVGAQGVDGDEQDVQAVARGAGRRRRRAAPARGARRRGSPGAGRQRSSAEREDALHGPRSSMRDRGARPRPRARGARARTRGQGGVGQALRPLHGQHAARARAAPRGPARARRRRRAADRGRRGAGSSRPGIGVSSTKVGLATSSGSAPSPRARPRTNAVLPAPSSPESSTTSPPRKARGQLAPPAPRVSAARARHDAREWPASAAARSALGQRRPATSPASSDSWPQPRRGRGRRPPVQVDAGRGRRPGVEAARQQRARRSRTARRPCRRWPCRGCRWG